MSSPLNINQNERTIIIVVAMLCLGCNPGKKDSAKEMAEDHNQEVFTTKAGEKDAEFVVNTVEASYEEISLAHLALNKSNDRQVKKIAGMLEKDQNEALGELKSLASKKGITVPTTKSPEAFDNEMELKKENQSDFNKDWLTEMEGKQKKIIREFESYWKDSHDEDLKTWISSTLPHLRNHLDILASYRDQIR